MSPGKLELKELTLYGAAGSGSIAVEAALTLLNIPYELVEAVTWDNEQARERVSAVNAMRQVPVLVYPDGEVMTESAAILIDLADRHPGAMLAPPPNDAVRRQFLRWMVYVSSAIYSLYWIKPDVTRIGAARAAEKTVIDAVHERIAFCWKNMDSQLSPARYLLGNDLTVLDIYVTVVSRFGPWRKRFYESAPKMAAVARRVDGDPRLVQFWAKRFPFDDVWEN
jgi:GST-like protein